MFESITITENGGLDCPPKLDFGFLLECLLFYKKVHLVVGERGLAELIQHFGEDLLCLLLDDEVLSVHYEFEHFAIHTKKIKGIERHHPITFYSPNHTLNIALNRALAGQAHPRGTERRRALRLLPKIKILNRDGVAEAAMERLSESSFVTTAAEIAFRNFVPSYTKAIRFECVRDEHGFIVDTDISFSFVNAVRKAANQSEITPSLLLSAITRVEADLSLSAAHLSEIATSGLGAQMIKLRMTHLAKRLDHSEATRLHFSEVVLGEAKALRYALADRADCIQEIVAAILAAKPFKEWLSKHDPTEDLVRQYYKDVAATSVFDKLPGKSVRWAICAGLGLAADASFSGGVGSLLGNTLGALDTFYFDRLIRGWRPNHFVEDKLAPIIQRG